MTDVIQAKRLLLSEYERERRELDGFITRLRRELGIASEEAVDQPEEEAIQATNGSSLRVEDFVKPGDFYRMTQLAAVREFLERRGQRNTASLQEIAQALLRGKAIEAALDDKGMRNLSSNLSKTSDFQSIAKGRWGLAKWYGGAGKGKKKKQDSEPETEKVEAATDAEPEEKKAEA
ncbi:MAG: hypothetical protein WBQ76_16160 [Candidatus Korobacteraceae bacterium]